MGMKTNMDVESSGKSGNRVCQLKLEAQRAPELGENCAHEGPHSVCQGECAAHLAASASSPSLLTGCGDPSTPIGARIERHLLSHHVSVVEAPLLCQQTNDSSRQSTYPTPLSSPLIEENPPLSAFLTPAPPRPRQSQGRPVSAPSHHLERISGALLRLVGDHYLCSTCGRQLRNIGDQLTLETSLRHAFSSRDITGHSDR